MKSIATLLLVLFALTVGASAQPQTYIIPDIGAPGLNTYMEIVAPQTASGAFGNDDLYTNNPGDAVRVEVVNPADNARLVIGPVVVSWNGRLISTQVFVKPGAALGAVSLKVFANGSYTTLTDQFQIVNPQSIGVNGTLSGGGVLGSGGAFGTRSQRGAMIVDSMILNGGTFSVATTNANGYFPFILISKGQITFLNSATLGVNGGTPDASAGGGGGGGKFCDNTSNTANTGGNGYTAGGAGGQNGSFPFPASSKGRPGTSTGPSGTSLNGAPGGDDSCAFENAGGGTGHPFGQGGAMWCGGGDPFGRYGGGAGAGQTGGGGGGGFATNGTAGTGANAGNTAGLAHGNIMNVPIAGGSGGASGNPRGVGATCAGAGGAGGGAIALYAMRDFGMTGGTALEAKGGDGGSGNGGGGGGSGGYTAFGAKVRTSSATVGRVNSGAGGAGTSGSGTGGRGGDGRGRYDGFITSTPIFSTSAIYVGLTTDTLTYRDSAQFLLGGTFNGSSQLRVYMRGSAGPWTLLGTPATAGRTWSMPVTVATADTYYFAALQRVTNPVSGSLNDEPDWVMSQSAANVVRVVFIARISGNDTLRFKPIACETSIDDSVLIENSGDADLIYTPTIISKNAGDVPGDFSVITPAPYRVAPHSTMRIKVRFTPTGTGTRRATLRLTNNDPRVLNGVPRNPYDIVLIGIKRRTIPGISQPELDFRDTCVGSTMTRTIRFTYSGDTAGSLISITRLGTGPSMFSIDNAALGSLPKTNLLGDTAITITVRFTPTSPGAFADSFRIATGPCGVPVTFKVKGNALDLKIRVTPDPLDFGNVRVNTTATLPVTIENIGNTTGMIFDATVSNTTGAGSFGAPTGLKGTILRPGAKVTANVTFTPTASGQVTARLCVSFVDTISGNVPLNNTLCPATVCIDLKGRGVTSLLILSRKTMELRADSCSDPAPDVTDTFKLYNAGAASEKITGVSAAGGKVTITSVPAIPPQATNPLDLNVGDTILFTVTWKPGATGTQTEQIVITTTSAEPNQQRMTVDVTMIRDRSLFAVNDISGGMIPDPLDFGRGFNCNGPSSRTVRVSNTGTMDESIHARLATGSQGFTITSAPDFSIAKGGSPKDVTITFSPSTTGAFVDTLVITNSRCNQEVRIPLSGERYVLRYKVTGITFGTSNVGIAKRGTATIQFEPTTPNDVHVNVKEATINQTGTAFSIVTPQPMNKQLAPNEVASVDVDFTPTAQQPYNGTICFHIDSPCDTTICVPLDGSGIQSNIIVRQSTLNFGALYFCEDSTLDVKIENGGLADLQITDLIIGGTDAIAFEQIAPASKQFTLAPGTSETVRIRFVPSRSAGNGAKSATLEIKSTDPAQPSIIVTLIGERRQQVLATPISLDFGRVEVGKTSDKTIVLENRTDEPIGLESLGIVPPFTVIDPIVPPSRLIPAHGTLTVTIRFTPIDTIKTTQLLIAAENAPCDDTARIDVSGQGEIVLNGYAEIEIPDSLHGEPGDKLAIPIILRKSQLLTESKAKTLVATVRFNRMMLQPISARIKGEPAPKVATGASTGATTGGGTIISSGVQGNQRVVTFQLTPRQPMRAVDTLGFLDVRVLLGDSLATPIRFDSLGFTDATVTVQTTNGSFSLQGYCTVGGNRLVQISSAFGIKAVAPNPFNPSTEILFSTVEDGPTTLAIYDARGVLVETLINGAQLPTGAHIQVWNAERFASGLYYARLVTPTQTSVYRMVLVK